VLQEAKGQERKHCHILREMQPRLVLLLMQQVGDRWTRIHAKSEHPGGAGNRVPEGLASEDRRERWV